MAWFIDQYWYVPIMMAPIRLEIVELDAIELLLPVFSYFQYTFVVLLSFVMLQFNCTL